MLVNSHFQRSASESYIAAAQLFQLLSTHLQQNLLLAWASEQFPMSLRKQQQKSSQRCKVLFVSCWLKEYYIIIMLMSDVACTTGSVLPVLFLQKTELSYHTSPFFHPVQTRNVSLFE